MKDRLAQLVASGSTVTIVSLKGARFLLAAADLQPDGLWFYPAFGESQAHFIDADQIERDGPHINLYKHRRIVATVAPLETADEHAGWADWLALLATPQGIAIAESLQHMKEASK